MLKLRKLYLAIFQLLMRGRKLLYSFWQTTATVEDEKPKVFEARKPRDFALDVEDVFSRPLTPENLAALSDGLREQLKASLASNPSNMLPSYNHQLPNGKECGTYLALDMGGSTFRVALIRLHSEGSASVPDILNRNSFKIGEDVKQLEGRDFFEWMALRIKETVDEYDEDHKLGVLSMGLAWSFPIEQTSLRSGGLMPMGKNFLAAHGLIGLDLGDLIEEACKRQNLKVQINAIINDSSATLLSKAYEDPSTRFALIVGTGCNASVHLPVTMFGPSKFGTRPSSWHGAAKHVIVNTELSMFGKDVLPLTKWDSLLLSTHPRPDFQPFEYLVGGHYLGEIARLVLVEGIQTSNCFSGTVPSSLQCPYSLSTETLSQIQTTSLEDARLLFLAQHPDSLLRDSDIVVLRRIATHVSRRAAGFLAAGMHALWQLRNEGEGVAPENVQSAAVAFNGSVIENYPGFRETCQEFLDGLVEGSGGVNGAMKLTPANSSLLGAAVSVACL